MKYFLFRNPSTMEDEGRFFYMGSFPTLYEVEERRDKAVEDANGWYGRSSFTIATKIEGE